MTRTNVYFIQGTLGGPIKIGWASNVQSRLRDLQCATPTPLRLLLAVPGNERVERALHRCFAKNRLRGEWFEPTEDLVDLISTLRERKPISMSETSQICFGNDGVARPTSRARPPAQSTPVGQFAESHSGIACRVCRSRYRVEIEELLQQCVPEREIAARFPGSASYSTIRRHRPHMADTQTILLEDLMQGPTRTTCRTNKVS